VIIDQEVRRIVEKAHERAVELLTGNQDKLHLLANTLLERETLDGDEMDRVLRGETLEPQKRDDSGPSADAPVAPPAVPATDDGQQLDAFGGPAPRPAGA
jgi:cell division protease FtsH